MLGQLELIQDEAGLAPGGFLWEGPGADSPGLDLENPNSKSGVRELFLFFSSSGMVINYWCKLLIKGRLRLPP